jgi:hypothetical protein
MVDPKHSLNVCASKKWENNYGVNPMLETDLIYLTLRRVHTLEMSLREMRTPEFSTGGWRICLSTRQYDE